MRDDARVALAALLLLAAVAAVYAPVRSHAFIDIDDMQLVALHPLHRAPLSADAIRAALTRSYHLNWIPVTSLSLQLDAWLWGIDAGRTLVANAVLHALAALVLWRALARATGDRWRSFFVAGVFALHPLHVESVAWASSRKDVLAGLFFALTLSAYAGFVRRPSPRRYGLVALWLALGLLSKPVLVTLPFVLLLLDFWPFGRVRRDDGHVDARRALLAAAEKLPLLALVLVSGLLTLAAQRAGGATRYLGDLSPRARFAQALLSVAYDLGDAFWPQGLAMPYPHPGESVSLLGAAAAGALLIGISALVWRRRLTHPHGIVGWLWFVGMLVPVLGLLPVGYAARADRYTYLPLIGLSIAVVWSVPDAWSRSHGGRRALGVVACAVLAALAVAARLQVGYWQDTFHLMERALAVTQDNAEAHLVLARAHARQRDVARARAEYEAVLRLEPQAARPVFELAYLLDRNGAPLEALALYERGVALDPGFGLGQEALAFALERQGRLEEALAHYALGRPGPLALRSVARLAEQLGRHGEALDARQRLVALLPDDPAAVAELALSLASCPDASLLDPLAALRWIEPVAVAHPDDPRVLEALAAALSALGRADEAAAVAERAVAAADDADRASLRQRLARPPAGYIERR